MAAKDDRMGLFSGANPLTQASQASKVIDKKAPEKVEAADAAAAPAESPTKPVPAKNKVKQYTEMPLEEAEQLSDVCDNLRKSGRTAPKPTVPIVVRAAIRMMLETVETPQGRTAFESHVDELLRERKEITVAARRAGSYRS